jgi:hypothetical protein
VLGGGVVLAASYLVPWQRNPVSPCLFLNLTGYPCALCGGTRAFQAMAHGAWGAALHQNPLACVLFLGVVAVVAWHALGLVLAVTTGREVLPRIQVRPRWWMAALGVLLFVANWVHQLRVAAQ